MNDSPEYVTAEEAMAALGVRSKWPLWSLAKRGLLHPCVSARDKRKHVYARDEVEALAEGRVPMPQEVSHD